MSKYSEKVERRRLAALEEEKNERAARAVNAVKPTKATDPFSVIPDPIVRTFITIARGNPRALALGGIALPPLLFA